MRKAIIIVLFVVGLLVIIGAVVMNKKTAVKPADTAPGIDPNLQVGDAVSIVPQPFQGCVTPPSDRQPYSESNISWDYRNVLKDLIPQYIRKQFEKSLLEEYVHGALKAANVRVNQNSVGKMQTYIIAYLQSSDKKPFYQETTGRLRCK